MLHVTNGDSTATTLRRIGLAGEVIAWRDVLHEGPTPGGLVLEAMSDVRARFLASWGAGTFPEIRRDFGARDAALRGARNVVLWFEHDLYDQLQLIQLLATLANQPETSSELICIAAFPGVSPFYGLGQLTSSQLASLWPQRRRVGPAQLALGTQAWKAFCSPDPTAVREFLRSDLTILPYLRAALERHLEEFPAPPDGLSRTERQILHAVEAGSKNLPEIFAFNQKQEDAPFIGDTTLQAHIEALVQAPTPLLTRDPIMLTPAGRRVLGGEIDARQLNRVDRWIGGVHLVG